MRLHMATLVAFAVEGAFAGVLSFDPFVFVLNGYPLGYRIQVLRLAYGCTGILLGLMCGGICQLVSLKVLMKDLGL